MSYVALYRKYRPKKFSEVIGQEHIVSALEGALRLGTISHAYLFVGSRGTGKTTMARIFADAIGVSANDIYEIDAASNRGIDDVRQLREGVNSLPFESPYKVYIVDEVHMFTKEAFNALLKTLEEPPKHVIFILATTELEKLPETVVSRCQVFTFRRPTQEVLKRVVLSAAKKEGAALEPASAELIALLGDGSFRDTLGTLQKVLSASGGSAIAQDDVARITGAPKNSLVNDLLRALDEKDVARGLEVLRQAAENSLDPVIFLKLALMKLRFVLLLRYAPEMKEGIGRDVSEEDLAFLQKLAEKKGPGITSETLLELLKASDLLGFSAIPELPLELAVIKLCRPPTA